MELELSGRRALVTGSSRGIGRAIAELLYAEGCQVVLNGRTVEDLEKARDDMPGAMAVAGDVTREDDAQRVVDESVAALGVLDILVCNVGSGRSVPPGDETYAEWRRIFEVNLWSTTNTVEAARKVLASGAVIICVSSICGIEVVPGAPDTYSAAKAALNAYVRGMARPLGKHGIRIHAVAPGNILFDDSTWSQKLSEDAGLVEDMLEREVALSRLGTAREVAELVAYLASPRASFATGCVWPLDGGQLRS